jgi:hypothetical protein
MIEQWRPIIDFPRYEISDLGRVRRLVSATNTKAGKILILTAIKDGYLSVNLCGEAGIRKRARLNRLVCEAFYGPAPTPKHHAAHRNGDIIDNRLENLYWATPRDNCADRDRHGTTARGERGSAARLSDSTVALIRLHIAKGEELSAIAPRFGVTRGTISKIKHGRTWRHVK